MELVNTVDVFFHLEMMSKCLFLFGIAHNGLSKMLFEVFFVGVFELQEVEWVSSLLEQLFRFILVADLLVQLKEISILRPRLL